MSRGVENEGLYEHGEPDYGVTLRRGLIKDTENHATQSVNLSLNIRNLYKASRKFQC